MRSILSRGGPRRAGSGARGTGGRKAGVAREPGFVAGSLPGPIEIDNPCGRYRLAITAPETGLRIEREFSLKRARIEAGSYAGLRRFLADARKGDLTALTFVRREDPGPS